MHSTELNSIECFIVFDSIIQRIQWAIQSRAMQELF